MVAEQSMASKTKAPRRIQRVLITPEQAEQWLAKNIGNRNLRHRKVEEIAGDIIADRWNYNFQAVIFDWDGNLIDGQHRLHAIVRAGRAVVSDVVYDADPEVAKDLDNGTIRTGADVAKWRGIENSAAGCAIVRWVIYYEAGKYTRKDAKCNPSRSAIVDKLQQMNTEVQEAIHMAEPLRHLLPCSVAGFLFLRLSKLDKEMAVDFFKKLASGIGYDEGSALHRLRERLIENRGSRAKLPDHYMIALAIKAWNYFIYGKKMRFLRWKDDEPFPDPVAPGVADSTQEEEAA